MTGPERIWTASTDGKCHVGFDTPSLNYVNEYIRADLAAVDALKPASEARQPGLSEVEALVAAAFNAKQAMVDMAEEITELRLTLSRDTSPSSPPSAAEHAQQPAGTTPQPGEASAADAPAPHRSPPHAGDYLAGWAFQLTTDEVAKLDAALRPFLPPRLTDERFHIDAPFQPGWGGNA